MKQQGHINQRSNKSDISVKGLFSCYKFASFIYFAIILVTFLIRNFSHVLYY